MLQINIPLSKIKAAMACMAKKDIRYCLSGVHVMQKESVIYLEGTDGHIACRIMCGAYTENFQNFIVPGDVLESLAKIKKPKKGSDVDIAITYNPDTKSGTIDVLPFTAVDGRFPDIDNVIPKWVKSGGSPSGVGGTFDPNLLIRLWDSMKHAGVNPETVEFQQNGPYNVAVYRTGGFLGLVLPLW
jgi:hypothetical protein